MSASVVCYAGSTFPEHPRAVEWAGQLYEVKDILNRRREPSGVGFLVRCNPDEMMFDLFYRVKENQWQILLTGPAVIVNEHQTKSNF